mmetsp:Transcript_5762/g.12194  ORF Transcript_5762/g.12194 Transcript_5762/m.12194 type:complete len:267 (-) Transcript_5762:1627-2427(-)
MCIIIILRPLGTYILYSIYFQENTIFYSSLYELPEDVLTVCPALAPFRTGLVVIVVPFRKLSEPYTLPVMDPSGFCVKFRIVTPVDNDTVGFLELEPLSHPNREKLAFLDGAVSGLAFLIEIVEDLRTGFTLGESLAFTAGFAFAGNVGLEPKKEKGSDLFDTGAGAGAGFGAGAAFFEKLKKEKGSTFFGTGAGMGSGAGVGFLGVPKKEKGSAFFTTGAGRGAGAGAVFLAAPKKNGFAFFAAGAVTGACIGVGAGFLGGAKKE